MRSWGMPKPFIILVLLASLLVPCQQAIAVDRKISFKIEEPLPEGHPSWTLSFKVGSKDHGLRIEEGRWSSPVDVEGSTTPRILVGACHDDECSGMKVFGEMLPITLDGAAGEVLVSNLVIGNMVVPFEIRLRWSSPATVQPLQPPSNAR